LKPFPTKTFDKIRSVAREGYLRREFPNRKRTAQLHHRIYRALHRLRQTPTLASREAYARWAEDYPPEAHNPFMALEQDTMRAMLPPLEGKRVLDLACGTGRWGKIATEHGAAMVFSMDDSREMLRAGRPSLACAGSMTALPFKAACADVILCGLAIGHLQNLYPALREIKRVLAPGGTALISDLHPVQAWLGAKRTFSSGGKTLAVEHHIHSYADYHATTTEIGLIISRIREVSDPPVLLVVELSA
jgi:malonyl-CoA O-methyltransferase